MVQLVIGLCAVVITLVLARHWSAKTRLVGRKTNEIIARKLLTTEHSAELHRLREENSVMRNLLIDMVENEASIVHITKNTPPQEKARAFNDRTRRRREIFGEAMYILERSQKAKIPAHLPQ